MEPVKGLKFNLQWNGPEDWQPGEVVDVTEHYVDMTYTNFPLYKERITHGVWADWVKRGWLGPREVDNG